MRRVIFFVFSILVVQRVQGQAAIQAQLNRIETALSNGFSSLRNSTQDAWVVAKLTAIEEKLDRLTRQVGGPQGGIGHFQTPNNSTFAPITHFAATNIDTSSRPQQLKLRFKVEGRNLPDKDTGISPFDTSDSYYEWYVSTDGGATKKKMVKSDTINDSENPDWGNILEFDFDRKKNQYWFFYVGDHDNLREDDTVGRAWVNVADYVDKGQKMSVRLDKKTGHLNIQTVGTPAPVAPGTPIGQMPMPPNTPETGLLRFQVSAQNLPTKDDVGFIPGRSDPYVIVKAIDGISGNERDIGRSGTVTGSSNPVWGDVFQFQWDRKKDQRLRFTIYDDDTLRDDDKLGNGWMEVNDYVAKGELYTLILPKKGTLTIRKA